MIWSLWLLCGLVVALYIRWRLKNAKSIELGARLPGPSTVPILGNAAAVAVKDEAFINVIQKWIDDYGDLVRIWFGPDLNVMVSNPDHIKALLSSSKTAFKGKNYKFMADVLGGGILSGSGPMWRRDRKIASPNYGRRAVEAYTEVFNKESTNLIETLRTMPHEQIDIYKQIVKCTSYAVCQTLMGVTREETMTLPHLQYLIDGTHEMYQVTFDRMTQWYMHIDPVFWLSGKYTFHNIYTKRMAEFSDAIVGYRRKNLQDLSDEKLRTMMKVSDNDSTENTRLSVIDRFVLSKQLDTFNMQKETFTIFTSSQEASAKISCFLLMMMAYHPKCQEKLITEIKSVVGLAPGPITDEHLRSMPYLEMVFKEVVRLFPIGGLIQREVVEDFQLTDDITLPTGSAFLIPIFHIHRDPRHWQRPDDFDPERFTPENSRSRHPFSYIPFSHGAMDCLGRHFGSKLVKTICIKVLREFHISSLETYKDLRLKIVVSVSSINRFHLTLTTRKLEQEGATDVTQDEGATFDETEKEMRDEGSALTRSNTRNRTTYLHGQ